MECIVCGNRVPLSHDDPHIQCDGCDVRRLVAELRAKIIALTSGRAIVDMTAELATARGELKMLKDRIREMNPWVSSAMSSDEFCVFCGCSGLTDNDHEPDCLWARLQPTPDRPRDDEPPR